MGLKNRTFGVFCIVGILALGLTLPALAGAAALPLPPRPTPELPVVVTMAKEPSPTLIILSLDLTSDTLTKGLDPQTLWTVVQWRDALGDWHDVEGWVGVFDTLDALHAEKCWGILRRNFGQSPFRWLVYAEQGGALVAESETFVLPSSSGQVVNIQAVPVTK